MLLEYVCVFVIVMIIDKLDRTVDLFESMLKTVLTSEMTAFNQSDFLGSASV